MMPAPSPITKPSRSRSKGRDACIGSSLRVESAHGSESGHAHRSDGRLGAATNHHVGIATLDDFEAVADRVRAGGTRGGSGRVWTFRTVANRHLAGGEIDDCGNDEERRNPIGP